MWTSTNECLIKIYFSGNVSRVKLLFSSGLQYECDKLKKLKNYYNSVKPRTLVTFIIILQVFEFIYNTWIVALKRRVSLLSKRWQKNKFLSNTRSFMSTLPSKVSCSHFAKLPYKQLKRPTITSTYWENNFWKIIIILVKITILSYNATTDC